MHTLLRDNWKLIHEGPTQAVIRKNKKDVSDKLKNPLGLEKVIEVINSLAQDEYIVIPWNKQVVFSEVKTPQFNTTRDGAMYDRWCMTLKQRNQNEVLEQKLTPQELMLEAANKFHNMTDFAKYERGVWVKPNLFVPDIIVRGFGYRRGNTSVILTQQDIAKAWRYAAILTEYEGIKKLSHTLRDQFTMSVDSTSQKLDNIIRKVVLKKIPRKENMPYWKWTNTAWEIDSKKGNNEHNMYRGENPNKDVSEDIPYFNVLAALILRTYFAKHPKKMDGIEKTRNFRELYVPEINILPGITETQIILSHKLDNNVLMEGWVDRTKNGEKYRKLMPCKLNSMQKEAIYSANIFFNGFEAAYFIDEEYNKVGQIFNEITHLIGTEISFLKKDM